MVAELGRCGVVLLVTLAACATRDLGNDEQSDETGGESEAPQLAWVYESSECGHAYGVVAHGADAIVVGAIAGRPWIARIDEHGELVWERNVDRDGVYFAVDHGLDDATVVAVGRHTIDSVDHGLVETFTSAGADGSSFVEVGGPGSALYGIASIADGYAVTGIQADFDMLVGVVDPGAGELAMWPSPSGSGNTASIGFGVREIASGGLAVCGRESLGEGGRPWTARFDGSGEQVWTTSGPDPGIGASLDCWALAVGPSDDVFIADSGYTGAHLASYAADDGALRWEASEPNVGTQAIDVGPDGTVYVGGWSADSAAEPFRSHSVGEQSGWLAAFEPDGSLRWRVPAAMPLSITALRVHDDGAITVVGDLEPASECSKPWIARFEPE